MENLNNHIPRKICKYECFKLLSILQARNIHPVICKKVHSNTTFVIRHMSKLVKEYTTNSQYTYP